MSPILDSDSESGSFRVYTTPVTRKVGAVHLVLGGVTNLATATWLWSRPTAARLDIAIAIISRTVSEAELLVREPLIATVTGSAWTMLCVLLAFVGCWQAVAGIRAFRGTKWRWAIGAGIAGLVNPLAFPVGAIALTLLFVTRWQFNRSSRETQL